VDKTFIFYNGMATSSGAVLEIRQETTDEVVDIPITHFPCSIFWKAANPYIDENPGPQSIIFIQYVSLCLSISDLTGRS
jgi:hypothetical protein